MRILLVTPEFPPEPGGIGTHCFEMAKHWSLQVEVTVVAPRGPAPRSGAGFSFALTEVQRSGNAFIRLWRVARAVRRILHESPADLIYCGHWRASGIAARLATTGLSRKPVYIQAIHGSEVLYLLRPGFRNTVHKKIFEWVTSTATCMVALGSYQAQILQRLGVDRERVFTSPEGVDLSLFDDVDRTVVDSLRARLALKGKRVILTVGRLVERKGHDVVIRALPAIVEQVPTATYLIVGSGPNEIALRRLVRDVGVGSDRIRFCGRVPAEQLTAYYSLCDVFVMPNREVGSDTEGFGIVFIEAGACRKPCIGGRSGGSRDAIVDGETGILVDPSSHSEVAKATVTLLNDDGLSSRLGAAARQRIEKELQYVQVANKILARCISSTSHLVSHGDQVLAQDVASNDSSLHG